MPAYAGGRQSRYPKPTAAYAFRRASQASSTHYNHGMACCVESCGASSKPTSDVSLVSQGGCSCISTCSACRTGLSRVVAAAIE
jgi:hypothetical protein